MNNSITRSKGLLYCESEDRDSVRVSTVVTIALEHAKRKPRFPRMRPRLIMTMVIALLVAGCHERLAQQDEYFAPLSGVITAVRAETERLVTYHEALQALQRSCTSKPSTLVSQDAVSFHSPVPGAASADETRKPLCVPSTRTSAAYGSASKAYTRWVEDRVRPLPDPSETASSITGG